MRGVWAMPRGVRVHLCALVGTMALLRAVGFWLQTYGLLFSQRGVVYGAGYADLHATLPMLRVLVVLAAITGVLLLASTRARTLRAAGVSAAVLGVAWIGGDRAVPAVRAEFTVAPNELRLESPYIKSSIDATLHAYNLDQVEEKQFAANTDLTPAVIEANRTVLDNVRLWDDRPLLQTYAQIQSLRLYYTFTSVGIDRYRIGGHEQQVMLSARELDVTRVSSDARTWVNDHLVFTHGYGLVMSPVNLISGEGLPDLYIKDIPPQSIPGLPVTRPELYYGLIDTPYAVVNTRTKELDYPQGDQNVYASYAGTGGVPLGGSLTRLAFMYRFGDLPLVLSTDITPQSRIMFYRSVPDRLSHIAPFLTFDRDPYLVLADGRLFWIVDGYTTSSAYPYAQPAGGINYIRNSVKVVVDAYNGATRFYVVDPSDPIVQTYARVFPGVFQPFSTMPPVLVAHLRYPVDLFLVQAQIYDTYHMTDPRVFYNREDVWATPNELFAGNQQPLDPYYVNLHLDPAVGDEFALILPFTPSGKDNMVAWMAGRSDAPNYGRLLVYRFPKDRTVFGPMQIEARINQDPGISAQLTLWNQQGSQVIRGNLLVVPIADALLYIEPLYLQAEGSALPELKRVIVAYGTQISMEPTPRAGARTRLRRAADVPGIAVRRHPRGSGRADGPAGCRPRRREHAGAFAARGRAHRRGQHRLRARAGGASGRGLRRVRPRGRSARAGAAAAQAGDRAVAGGPAPGESGSAGREPLEQDGVLLGRVHVHERGQLGVETPHGVLLDDADADGREESGGAVPARDALFDRAQAGGRVDRVQRLVLAVMPRNHDVDLAGERGHVSDQRRVQKRHVARADERRAGRRARVRSRRRRAGGRMAARRGCTGVPCARSPRACWSRAAGAARTRPRRARPRSRPACGPRPAAGPCSVPCDGCDRPPE